MQRAASFKKGLGISQLRSKIKTLHSFSRREISRSLRKLDEAFMPSRSQTLPKSAASRNGLFCQSLQALTKRVLGKTTYSDKRRKIGGNSEEKDELKRKEEGMDRYSISFTLGKATEQHGANIEHNNRRFTAANVDERLSINNIIYTSQGVRNAYNQLFGQALSEYNAKQYRQDRIIQDYYAHICNGNREEPYYEVVVQFGDMKTAPCGSEQGKIVTEMLDEYMKAFQQRNPNLHVFNAVLHLDEASPHLHIDFIPFYTQGRTNGLSKGVSMKAALDEMGFRAKGQRINRLVLWEERERNEMEHILQQHGYEREDKNAHYAHMTVTEYKSTKDKERIREKIRELRNVPPDDLERERVRALRMERNAAQQRVAELEKERQSTYRAFFYSSPEKQEWVMKRLEEMDIPYRETDNGFEAQECYINAIRKIEKEYKAPRTILRDKLRNDIDLCILKSATLDDALQQLEELGYTIKHGKYLSVKPENSNACIRLKSLGEYYTERALRNRIKANEQFEREIAKMLDGVKQQQDSLSFKVLYSVRVYMTAFRQSRLPIRKRDQLKPVMWTNDTELDAMLALNKRVQEGATLESLRHDFAEKEKTAAEKTDAMLQMKSRLKNYYDWREQLEILFDGKQSDLFTAEQAKQVLKIFPSITEQNWKNVYQLVETQEKNLQNANAESEQAQKALSESAELVAAMERITNGSYVQSLAAEESYRRISDILPNGTIYGGGAIT